MPMPWASRPTATARHPGMSSNARGRPVLATGVRRRLLHRFAVLGQIETFDLVLLAYPQREEEVDCLEQNVGEQAGPDEDRDDGVELDQHLSGVALQQSRRSLRRVRT